MALARSTSTAATSRHASLQYLARRGRRCSRRPARRPSTWPGPSTGMHGMAHRAARRGGRPNVRRCRLADRRAGSSPRPVGWPTRTSRSTERIGAHGAELIPDGANVLTHCNTGALATVEYGTALGVIRAAVEAGKRLHVFVDETRPFLQGARLTAWELQQDGIPLTLITDNMAGHFMIARRRRPGGRRRRPDRRQRRRREQDRHLHAGRALQGERHSVLRRGADLDHRPVARRAAPRSRSRSARRTR